MHRQMLVERKYPHITCILSAKLQASLSGNFLSKDVVNQRLEFEFSVALRPQRPYGLLGTGSPGHPFRFLHTSWALFFSVALRPQKPYGLLGTATLTFTQSLSCSSLLFYIYRDRTDYMGQGSPGRPPRPSHSFWALTTWEFDSPTPLCTVNVHLHSILTAHLHIGRWTSCTLTTPD